MWSRRTDRPWTHVSDSCLLLGEHWPMDGTVRGRRWGWGPLWDGFRYDSRSSWLEDGVLPPVLNQEETKLVKAMQTKMPLGYCLPFLKYLECIVGVSSPAFFMLHFRIQLLLVLFQDVREVWASTALCMILFAVTVMRLWNADCEKKWKHKLMQHT